MPNDNSKVSISHDRMLNMALGIQSVSSIDALFTILGDELKVSAASYHHILDIGTSDHRDRKRYYAYNIPSPLLDYFDKKHRLQKDPGVQYVFSKGHFGWLSDMMKHKAVIEKGDDKGIKTLIAAFGDFLLIPLYGPQNRRGYGTFNFGKQKIQFSPIFPWQIQSIFQIAHVKYCLLLSGLQSQVKLTNRESEVLELMTYGKTNPEIGVILNISANTVSSYVKQIYLKLGTTDRVTTALKARTLSLIG